MIDSILILAAGRGARLLPLTIDTPKPLLEIDAKNLTILDRIIHQCRSFLPGVPVNINIGYYAEKVLLHWKEKAHQSRPSFLYEKEILGPAETLVQYSTIEKGRTLVMHGDLVVSNNGFDKFTEFANNRHSQIIVCHERFRSRARSEVVTTQKRERMECIIEFTGNESEKNKGVESNRSVLVSSGIFVIDLAKVTRFKAERNESLSPRLLNFINSEAMDIYLWNEWRFAIDSLSTLNEARMKIILEREV